ncbi:MAG: hypothetical protein LBG19_02630 [Prevotellaceae bacterium]|jgi:hypothetical protein|nr:hypothetical protein [Prevotellaceae bacterium]
MKKLALKDLLLSRTNPLSSSEKKELLRGLSYPCQPRYFCKSTTIARDECAIELPPAECNCTLGGR